jgi:hypothetical protein
LVAVIRIVIASAKSASLEVEENGLVELQVLEVLT